jgi:hypothetical protein
MGSLPSSIRRRLCCCQAGIVVLVMIVLPLSMCRHLCSPGTYVVVAITLLSLSQWHCCHCQAGVVALITMALLPLLIPRHLPHCHIGVIAARALLLLLRRCCHPYCADLFTLTLYGHCHCCCTGVVAPIKLACLCRCTGVAALVTLVLLPLVRWH